MDEDGDGSTGPIDFPRNNIGDDEREVDAIAHAIAPSLIFNAVAFPPDIPEDLKSALTARVEQDRSAASEAGFIMTEPERLSDGKTAKEQEKEREEKALA